MNKDDYTIDLRPYFVVLRHNPRHKARAVVSAGPVVRKKSFTRGVIEWGIYAVLFALIVWGTPALLTDTLKSDFPIASITSSSMWPELKQGDIVFIQGVSSKNDVEVGDIVVYENKRGFTIHRIVKMNQTTITTRGDANNTDDLPVGYDKLVGKAVEWNDKTITVPMLGKLSMYLNEIKEKGYFSKSASAESK